MTNSSLYGTYNRADLLFEKGQGAWLTTKDNRRFLDFMAGIAVNSLGHAHPHLVEALKDQADKLWHLSNLYQIPGQEKLAERLCAVSFAEKVFFTNSGAEALECAIKTARRYHYAQGDKERFTILTFDGAFHGRTLATIAAGGQEKYLEGFGPKAGGFVCLPDLEPDTVKNAMDESVAAILIEPVQGESGIREIDPSFIKLLRNLCDESGSLLIFDEVQTGIGRTGDFFAHEIAQVEPDLVAIAKGIGGGFPLGACLAKARVADVMVPGTHGSTFGGNPLAMAVGNAVLDVILEEDFLPKVKQNGLYLKQRLAALVDQYPSLVETIRGRGLMLGVKMKIPLAEMIAACREEGLLVAPAGDNVARLIPPLIVGHDEIDFAVRAMEAALERIKAGQIEAGQNSSNA